MPDIALIVDELDWHARAMLHAFEALGAPAVPVRLADCGFDTTRPHGLDLPGFGAALPDAVFVRAVGGGSFEEVTRRLGILHAFRELGVPVWNDARAIERCVDKSTTSFLLARAGLPTPPTWTVEGVAAAQAVAARETAAGPLVLKPLFGSQGRGLRLIERVEDLPPPEQMRGVYYLQRYCPTGSTSFQDQRLFVCAGEVIAAMTRHAGRWVTNIRQGGRPERLEPGPERIRLALRAAECVGAAYAGVDLLRAADGRTLAIEINSMPGWKGLQKVTETAIAERLAAALLAQLS